jgi:hypothetical protein
MRKTVILLLLIFTFCGIARAQVYTARIDTLSAAMLKRLAHRTLSKSDSELIKAARVMLRLKKTDTISTDILIKVATGTISAADKLALESQLATNLKVDTNLMVNFKDNGLSVPHKKLDSLDLAQTSCSFEPEANAMVVYDVGQMASEPTGVRVERHKRIKIFNEKGKAAANIRIDYTNQFGAEQIDGIAGQTLNFNNGKIEYTPLDAKLIYRQDTSKYKGAVAFTMPNVKPGSVIEIRYIWHRAAPRALPKWSFQSDIPTRYSQYIIQLYRNVNFMSLDRTTMPLATDSAIFNGYGHIWAMRDVPSLRAEPFKRSPDDGIQSIELALTSATTPDGQFIDVARSWATVGRQLANDKELKKTFDQRVSDKEGLVKWARKLNGQDAKIAYLFNQVKTRMKWNGDRSWASKDGIRKAWEDKAGNWGEINMALCGLLNDAGVAADPMLVSTRDNGKMLSNFVNRFQPDKLVVYVLADSSRFYVLDASGKYNNFNEAPYDLLNSLGLWMDKENNVYQLVFLKNDAPVKQEVTINAGIKPDGTMEGTAAITSFSYNKTNALTLYNLLDEQKYKELLTDHDNNLTVRSIKLENAEVDSLPLIQTIDFKLNLPGTDDKYIYFNPNLFTGLHNNPFVSERRFSDIDFGCNFLFSINGKYKIPDGYKVDVLPKTQTVTMPDKSIIFKRVVLEQEGYVIVYYVINYKKSLFARSEYADVYDYFKRMTDLLNEQIVLKKI